MKPTLFLDIDGVLNSADYFRSRGPNTFDDHRHSLDPKAIERLNDLVDCTRCSVVVSSTWRLFHSMRDLRWLLEQRGYRFGLRGKTPELRGIERDRRGAEIAAWLRVNPTTRFAIVDDDSDMGPLGHKLVQTSFEHGLLDEHVKRLAALLSPPAQK